jgi:hypothetical protein
MGQQMADLNAFFPGRGELRPNWPVWPAPGVPEAHVELARGRSRSVSLIIRDDRQPFYPDLPQRIKVDDELLVVAPEDQPRNTEDRLRAVASAVGLARSRDGLRMSSAVRRCTAGYA